MGRSLARLPASLAGRCCLRLRNGQPEQIRLRAWLDRYDGPVPTYRIELATSVGKYISPYTATAPDMFRALVRLRRQLEPDGLTVAVQGSRRDIYLSGMMADMHGGTKVYVIRPGLPTRFEDLVQTLDDALPDQAVTVAEQGAFLEAWLAERNEQLQRP
jgi:hypothetical protein